MWSERVNTQRLSSISTEKLMIIIGGRHTNDNNTNTEKKISSSQPYSILEKSSVTSNMQ